MGTTSRPVGQAVYTASDPDWDWLHNVQKKLYERSWEQPDYVFRELWGIVTDPRNLRIALDRVSHNRGRRAAGVDGLTVRKVLEKEGGAAFLGRIREELRSGSYRPSAARRVLIPKPGQPGKHRPLGIQTVKDRTVQAAVKQVMEPIFEADFYPVSYGFRPGRSAHGALEHLRLLLRPRVRQTREGTRLRLPYQWAIEGDIKACFDAISHHPLMNRIRKRIADGKLNRLLLAFLKAGVMSEGQFLRTDNGVPQGGILSPLLANIALSAIEERYSRHVWPRQEPTLETDRAALWKRAEGMRYWDRRRKQGILFPIRYADDFIILIDVPEGEGQDQRAREMAEQEKAALAAYLEQELGLKLSETKTLITPVTERMRFLGYEVGVKEHPYRGLISTTRIPKDRSLLLRERIKGMFGRHTLPLSLKTLLQRLNPVLRGWGHFYRHAWGAKRVFKWMDYYVWWTIYRWLRKKYPRMSRRKLVERHARRKPGTACHFVWHDQGIALFEIARLKVAPYRMRLQGSPTFASNVYGEPGA